MKIVYLHCQFLLSFALVKKQLKNQSLESNIKIRNFCVMPNVGLPFAQLLGNIFLKHSSRTVAGEISPIQLPRLSKTIHLPLETFSALLNHNVTQ